MRRVAVIADVHGNAAALEAVLADVAAADVDAIVVAGDVVPGPQPEAVLSALGGLAGARHVRGNGDREVIEAYDARRPFDPDEPDPALRTAAWTAERIGAPERELLGRFEASVTVAVDGLGDVLVCHATPHSDELILTSLTPEPVVARAMEGVRAQVVVGGHTHVQYDRRVDGRRVVNAGSVGMPYEGRRGAFWALLGPDVELRRSEYDVESAARAILAGDYVDARELAEEILLSPPTGRDAEEYFERVAADRGER